MPEKILLLIAAAVIVYVVVMKIIGYRHIERFLQVFSLKNNLELQKGGRFQYLRTRVEGTVNGQRICLEHSLMGGLRNSCLIFRVFLRNMPNDFRACKADAFVTVFRKEFQTKDREFDRKVNLKGENSSEVIDWLDDLKKKAIVDATRYGNAVVNHTHIGYRYDCLGFGKVFSEKELMSIMNVFVDSARVLNA